MLLKRKWNVIWIAIVLVALVAFSSGCKKKATATATPTAAGAARTTTAAGTRAGYHGIFSGALVHRARAIVHTEMVGEQRHRDHHRSRRRHGAGQRHQGRVPDRNHHVYVDGHGSGWNHEQDGYRDRHAPQRRRHRRPRRPRHRSRSAFRSLQDAYFDYDKSDIREDARAALTKDAEALKSIFQEFPSAIITVEGHCDERGSAEYNLGLGDRRATAAKDFLVQLGVPADKLKTISYGKERPVCTESNEECWQRNRRAHFSAGQ